MHATAAPVDVSVEELLAAFESGRVPAGGFHHREHVRVAWLYLQRYTVLEALARFTTMLQRFAAAQGQPGRYHETITWAYLFLVNERMRTRSPGATWEQFAADSPDLLNWKPSILQRYYSEETLQSPLARATFLLPSL
jgi:hypothetical protein